MSPNNTLCAYPMTVRKTGAAAGAGAGAEAAYSNPIIPLSRSCPVSQRQRNPFCRIQTEINVKQNPIQFQSHPRAHRKSRVREGAREAREYNFIFITDLELLCNVIELPDDICGPCSVRPPSLSLSLHGTCTVNKNGLKLLNPILNSLIYHLIIL